jgi:hypothetical protein
MERYRSLLHHTVKRRAVVSGFIHDQWDWEDEDCGRQSVCNAIATVQQEKLANCGSFQNYLLSVSILFRTYRCIASGQTHGIFVNDSLKIDPAIRLLKNFLWLLTMEIPISAKHITYTTQYDLYWTQWINHFSDGSKFKTIKEPLSPLW